MPIFAHATGAMLGALPDPVPDTTQTREARDRNAIAQVAALIPVNAIETMVAVQFVTTSAHGIECQRLAQDADPIRAHQGLNLSVRLLRVAHSAANVLLRLQAARQHREASPDATNSAALTEHCTTELMLQARADQEAARTTARDQAARVAAQQVAETAARLAVPPPAPEPITHEDIAAAEAYAQTNHSNLNRARIMRRKGGMPNWGMFTPPAANVVRAIAFGHSPFLDTLLP